MEESRRLALAYVEKAAELSGDDSLILAVLGAVHTILRHLGTARIMLERAVTLDTNAAWAWSRFGWVEVYSDRSEQAIEKFERALRLSPLDPMNFNNYVGIGAAHEIAGRFDDALVFYRRALEERPHIDWLLRVTVSALVGAGRMDEARIDLKRLLTAYPGLTIRQVREAMVHSEVTMGRMCERLAKAGLPE